MSAHSLWMINHYANPPSLPGGTRHFELATRLRCSGWDVTIVASSFHHVLLKRVNHAEGGSSSVREIDGVPFVWLASHTTYRSNGLARMANMIEFAGRVWMGGKSRFKGQVPRPDIILGSSPHPLAPLAALWLARRFRVPFAMEVRDLWPETLVSMGFMPQWHPVVLGLRRLEGYLYRNADAIVTLLPAAREYLLEREVPSDKVSYVPNGVSVERFSCPERVTETSCPFVVCYTGAHGPANGLGNVLDAATLLAARGVKAEFHLYGDGPDKASLVARATGERILNVRFFDPVPKSHIPRILCDSDALLVSYGRLGVTQYGISPNKLWEYMAAGRPVLFAHEASNDPVADSGCGLSIPPQHPEALAEAVQRLQQMPPKERVEMGLRGRGYVREHHDWDQLADGLASALDEASVE